MNFRILPKKAGFSIWLVLLALFAFITMYPLIFLQTNIGMRRAGFFEKYQRARICQQNARRMAAMNAPDPNVDFTQLSTFTFSPGDFDAATYTLEFRIDAFRDPDPNYSFTMVATAAIDDLLDPDLATMSLKWVGSFTARTSD